MANQPFRWGVAMVKVGFIVEGDSEMIVIQSSQFRQFLACHNYQLVTPVINAKGGGNLLPQNIEVFLTRLKQQSVDKIVVVTDLEAEPSTEAIRERISHPELDVIFIAVKALEAWYLADTSAMRNWLKDDDFQEQQPEQTTGMPWDRLAAIARELDKRGPGKSKTAFAKRMIKHHGFSIENAANHPNCPSAKEMVDYFAAETIH